MPSVAQSEIRSNATPDGIARRICREACRASTSTPVQIVPGGQAPEEVGSAHHYTNASGDVIRHPSAYRRAWGKPIYQCSTIRVEVGEEWVTENCPDPTPIDLMHIGTPDEARKAMAAVGPAEHEAYYQELDRLEREVRQACPWQDVEPWLDGQSAAIAWQQARQAVSIGCRPTEWVGEDWAEMAAAKLAFAAAVSAYDAHRAKQPTDDQRRIRRPYLYAVSSEGCLIGDRRTDPRIVQVVVRDATTGYRHAITVPPLYGRVGCGHWRRLGSDAARVHAAIAWTFGLDPAEYRPAVEA